MLQPPLTVFNLLMKLNFGWDTEVAGIQKTYFCYAAVTSQLG